MTIFDKLLIILSLVRRESKYRVSSIVILSNSRVFTNRLKDLMQTEKISKRALSSRTGLERKSILNWLNGKFYPRYDALLKLSNFFCVSADYLLGRIDDNSKMVNTYELSSEKIHRSFINKLDEYIKKEKLSKYMIAKKLNVGQSTLSRWFESDSMPETAILIRIADLMEESVDYLMGRE